MHTNIPAFIGECGSVLRAVQSSMRRHRLVALLPLFVVVITLSLHPGATTGLRGEILSVGSGTIGPFPSEQSLSLASGVQMLLSPTAIVEGAGDSVRVRQGEVLVAGTGLVRLAAGPYQLVGWHGGFSVIVSGEDVTIASLTTPVVVTGERGETAVPIRSQWHGRSPLAPFANDLEAWQAARALQDVPSSYLEAQFQRLTRMTPSVAMQEAPSVPSLSLHLPALDMLRLPAAAARAGATARGVSCRTDSRSPWRRYGRGAGYAPERPGRRHVLGTIL